ncbi:GD15000 [Drosophila simulans]|uniref:GD15000 n=1 Tax=Drosophila simulans TaxID=7240 RepID=B4QKN2_DROSI|nr:GD15000 [Drosophila simulans]
MQIPAAYGHMKSGCSQIASGYYFPDLLASKLSLACACISWTRADGPPQSLDIWRFMCTMNGQSGNRNRRLRLQLKLKYQPTADQIDAVYRVPLHPETALPSI